MSDKALLTVNYGDKLSQNSRESMQDAARRWGVEYFEMCETTIPKIANMHPAAMKTAAFQLLHYEEIFTLDADIAVGSHCPSPFEQFTDPETFCAVVDMSPHECQTYEWNKLIAQEPHLACPLQHGRYFNSGVMLARRAHHAAMFNLAFQISSTDHGLGWIDQTPLNIAAVLLGVKIGYMHEWWNFLHVHRCGDFMNMTRDMPYILHFAGSPGREEALKTLRWRVP